eukprot:TRINITY_DN1179_c0_g1_i1.p4 TRINITY_DN1179_c0_g1~~TRINITY_DN1179_c0_g1_i1.p4  ORF type:complete len:530 (+),score=59.40 TRINITY_DN1179_c0_g1_i1:19181-20770(+)
MVVHTENTQTELALFIFGQHKLYELISVTMYKQHDQQSYILFEQQQRKMSFMKSIQKKIFGKAKEVKSPATASTNSGSSSFNFSFESVIFFYQRLSIRNVGPIEKGHNKHRFVIKARLGRVVAALYGRIQQLHLLVQRQGFVPNPLADFIKKAEEKVEQSQKQEVECELLKNHNEKLQEQHRQMVEENDTTITLNNELKAKISELTKELNGLKEKLEEVDTLKQSLTASQKTIDHLRDTIKKKDKIIIEYDDKFEQLEEQMQNAIGERRTTQSKASTLDLQLGKLQREIEELRKENESLLLSKEKEASIIAQERLDNKKAFGVLEKNIAHLSKEKAELEQQLNGEKPKIERSKKYSSREVQTVCDLKRPEDFSIKEKLVQREDESIKVQKYAASLKEELDQTVEKLSITGQKMTELKRYLESKEAECESTKTEIANLKAENAELKKRREAAATEINKLTLQLVKRNSRLGGESTPNNIKHKDGTKVVRHLSEAVFDSTNKSVGNQYERFQGRKGQDCGTGTLIKSKERP